MAQAASSALSRHRRDVPDQPTDLPKESFPRSSSAPSSSSAEDQLTTWAAALTYFGVLSLFPMLLALVSVLGVIGAVRDAAAARQLSNAVAPGPAKDILTNVLHEPQSDRAARRSR